MEEYPNGGGEECWKGGGMEEDGMTKTSDGMTGGSSIGDIDRGHCSREPY